MNTSHVVPALIRKCLESKERGEKKMLVWGTGNVSHEFLYVEDTAEGILLAAERYDSSEPVNLGSAVEITIAKLVDLIARLTGFDGSIEHDSSRPDGQPNRKKGAKR